jgi:hypothetical protein
MYASGPFTRIDFFLQRGVLHIAVSKRFADGARGDLVTRLPLHNDPRFQAPLTQTHTIH